MLEKRSFSLSGHRTSIALEAEFWSAVEHAAKADGVTVATLIAAVDAKRGPAQKLASALRVYVLLLGVKNAARIP